MRTVVLDASVVLKWFTPHTERGARESRRFRRDYSAGALHVLEPPLLLLEVLDVAGRRWGWGERDLTTLVGELEALRFEFALPRWGAVASWVSRGLTAYDAAYVALAAEYDVELITDDATIVAVAGGVARPLVTS